MIHNSNFIFLVVQLLLVQSNASDSNSLFYQKLLITTIRSRVPHVSDNDPIRKEPIRLHPDAFFEQTTTSITALHSVSYFDSSDRNVITKYRGLTWEEMNRLYEVYDKIHQKKPSCTTIYLGKGGIRKVGSAWAKCDTSGKSLSDAEIRGISLIIIFAICIAACVPIGYCIYHASNQKASAPMPGIIRLPRTNNPNLLPMESQRVIRTILRIDSIASTELQLPEIANFIERSFATNSLEQHTSSLPPVYDDVMRQSSVTITLNQQSLPPTYDDFMRRNNLKNETDQ